MTAGTGRGWRLFSALLAGLLVAASASRSAETLKPADPGSAEDVQDVLFFSDSRPVLIRLHVLIDGKPYATRWTEYLTRWFRFLDRDTDGFLDREEVGRAPDPVVLQHILSSPYTTYQFFGAPPLEDLDRDHDSKVSLAEFLRYYRQSPAGPVQLDPAFTRYIAGVQQDPLTETLYTVLDADKDGKLSHAELGAAASALRQYDQDDDEFISVRELQTGGAAPRIPGATPPLVSAMQAPAIPLMLLPREDAPRRITARLRVAKTVLEHYDKNKNRSLNREEIGMPRELFERLDANKDGELDAFELLRWIIVAPDAEVVLHLSRVEDKRASIEVIGKENRALRKLTDNTVAFSTEENCINLIAAKIVPTPQAQSIRQILVRQFQAIDQKNKGYLTEKQLRMPQFTYLHSVLFVADRNGDDCLDLDELNAWVDLTTSGLNCQTSVALAASGRGLFQILDADQDGRLSIRELRSARARLAPYDRDDDRSLSRSEIPAQYQVVVNPGAPNYQAGQFSGFRPPGTPPAAPMPRQGPLWFRKMDRNGDGDVSPNEFLGSREDFRRLDTDGDGLISLEEALRADAALRKK